jgi:A/G-specific adenine glycosylase
MDERRGHSDPPSAGTVDAFRTAVWAFYRDHRRQMPWRETDDPYAVLVSEVMLQQTQVARVLPRYAEWLEAFPTLEALACAPLAAVLARWQGLGYNRRAVALKRCAEECVERLDGRLPPSLVLLRALPGIGPVTAAAIMDYAFLIPTPFIETNVRAVFLHEFFPDAEGVPDSELMPLVEATWDPDDPRGWGYALMDYGSWLKKRHPNPSRRSMHHVRQSRFAGSRRQKRALLLRAVMAEPGRPAESYAAELGLEEGLVEELLGALASEGFLSRIADGWTVAD